MAETVPGRVSVNGAQLAYSTRIYSTQANSTRANSAPEPLPTCLVLTAIGSQPYVRLTPPPLDDHLRLVYVELRGSGRSTGNPTDLTFEVLSDDLEAVRADLGAERVVVLGHSILGALAIEYAKRRPEAVSHVILAGTPPSGDLGFLAEKGTAFFEEHATEERQQLLRDNVAGLPEGASMAETMYAYTPMRFCDPRFDAAPLFAEATADRGLLPHILGTLTPGWTISQATEPGRNALRAPVFVALGRHDYAHPFVLWDEVVDSLPRFTVQLFEKSGHQPFFEEPAAFAEAVVAWMAEQEPR